MFGKSLLNLHNGGGIINGCRQLVRLSVDNLGHDTAQSLPRACLGQPCHWNDGLQTSYRPHLLPNLADVRRRNLSERGREKRISKGVSRDSEKKGERKMHGKRKKKQREKEKRRRRRRQKKKREKINQTVEFKEEKGGRKEIKLPSENR